MLANKQILSIKNDQEICDKNSRNGDSVWRHRLKAKEFKHYFVVSRTPKDSKYESLSEEKLTIIPSLSLTRLFFIWDAFKVCRKIIKENKIDLITTQDPYECGLLGYILKCLYRIPLNVQIRTAILNNPAYLKEKYINKIYHFISWKIIYRAETIGVPSIEQYRELTTDLPLKEKVFIVPTILDLEKFDKQSKVSIRDKYNIKPESKIILFTGRLVKQKNLPFLIEQFKIIQKKYSDVYLFIVGDGPEKEYLSDMIKRLEVSNIVFTGAVYSAFMNDYYKAASIFVITSKYEGASKSLQEASCSALPVVTTSVTGAEQLVINNETGFIVEKGEELVEKILYLLKDSSQARKMGLKGREYVKNNLSKEKKLASYITMFEKTVNAKANKILLIQKATGISGSENHLIHLINGIKKDEWKVEFLLLVDPLRPVLDFQQKLREAGAKLHVMTVRSHYDLNLFLNLVLFFIKNRYNLVHTHLIHADLYATLAARLTGHKRVLSSKHAPFEFAPNGLFAYLEKGSIKLQRKVITISHALHKLYLQHNMAGQNKLVTIHYGYPLNNKSIQNNIRVEFNIPNNAPVLLMVARLVGFKLHYILLEAVSKLVKSNPMLRLILVGDGPLRQSIVDKIADLKLERNVILTGYRADVDAFYAASDLYVHSSTGEGFGIVLLEAMAHAKPIVGSNDGALPEIVKNGETGFLVPVKDPQALADAIQKLLISPEMVKTFGQKGYERLINDFTVGAMVKRTLEIYNSILED